MGGTTDWLRRFSAPATRTDAAALGVQRPAERHRPIVVPGPAPALRVLLFGSGPAAGWGVQQREQGLGGRLAASMAARLDREIEIVPVIDDHWDERDPIEALRAARPQAFDAVVAVSAYRRTMLDLPLPAWRRYVEELRDLLLVEAGPAGVIQVLALPWSDAVRRAPAYWGGPFGRKVVQLADAAADSVDDFRQIDLLELSVPVDPREWHGPAFSPGTYSVWGDEVAVRLGSRLVAPICSGSTAE